MQYDMVWNREKSTYTVNPIDISRPFPQSQQTSSSALEFARNPIARDTNWITVVDQLEQLCRLSNLEVRFLVILWTASVLTEILTVRCRYRFTLLELRFDCGSCKVNLYLVSEKWLWLL